MLEVVVDREQRHQVRVAEIRQRVATTDAHVELGGRALEEGQGPGGLHEVRRRLDTDRPRYAGLPGEGGAEGAQVRSDVQVPDRSEAAHEATREAAQQRDAAVVSRALPDDLDAVDADGLVEARVRLLERIPVKVAVAVVGAAL